MGKLSKRLLSAGLFTLAASALLVSTASARPSSALRMQDAESAAGEFDFVHDAPKQRIKNLPDIDLANWETEVEHKVHDIFDGIKHKVEDAKHTVEDAISQSGEWFKVLKHNSFPGVKMRLRKPKLCDPDVTQYSGYLDVSPTKHFFFWFFESRHQPKTDPLVMWLNGGPGCSSFLGLLMELGPCQVNEKGDGTIFNPHSWNANASVLFLDQPANVGFSYGDTVGSSTAAAQDVYALLQIFFAEFPKYQRLDFHLAGESYGGHYVPAIGSLIHEMNQYLSHNPQSTHAGLYGDLQPIRLESLMIGNGLTDARLQYPWYPEMAYNNSYGPVVDEAGYLEMQRHVPTCVDMIERCYNTNSALFCLPASIYCEKVTNPAFKTGLNPYDVRLKCGDSNLCYPIISAIQDYLNRPEVQHELGVDADKSKFESCNNGVGFRFGLTGDVMKPSQRQLIPLLNDGIRVLLYSGDADFICNWMGNKAWALALPWGGQYKMQDSRDRRWFANGHHAGDVRSAGPLTFLRVFGAGHMVPYDKPAESLDMLNSWIHHKRI
ncbi:hypothetical protein BGZ73_007126 [Actinomortierella ambigua]|nr:hypothetical protein BGZ73_007126 [Actinomortierella ambigua]